MDKTLLETLTAILKLWLILQSRKILLTLRAKKYQKAWRPLLQNAKWPCFVWCWCFRSFRRNKACFGWRLQKHCKRKNVAGTYKVRLLSISDEAGGYLVPAKFTLESCAFCFRSGLLHVMQWKCLWEQTNFDVPRYTADRPWRCIPWWRRWGFWESSVNSRTQNLQAKRYVISVLETLLRQTQRSIHGPAHWACCEGLATKLDKEGFKGETLHTITFRWFVWFWRRNSFHLPTGHDTFAEFDMDDVSDMIAQMPESLF